MLILHAILLFVEIFKVYNDCSSLYEQKENKQKIKWAIAGLIFSVFRIIHNMMENTTDIVLRIIYLSALLGILYSVEIYCRVSIDDKSKWNIYLILSLAVNDCNNIVHKTA